MDTIISICKDCGKEFEISPNEQSPYHSNNMQLPKRCKDCRKKRKEQKREQEAVRNYEADEKTLQTLLTTLPFTQIKRSELSLADPDYTLVIIGNGFDIMHGVKSSYKDFDKTIGKNNLFRFNMETYLDVKYDLWANLEDSLGRLNYSLFLDIPVLDMWLEDFGAYDPDAQAANFYGAIETPISPTFDIPRELGIRFKKWLKTLKADSDNKPFSFLQGNYKVLSFNYTEFIETLYGAKDVCYIHGKRKTNDEIILGHVPGVEDEQWDKVKLKPYKFKDPYKRYIMESAIETACREAAWYDDTTTKKCSEIIKKHKDFFDKLSETKDVIVIGHSLSEVDYPYFEEVVQHCDAKWAIGYHSLDDLKRLVKLVDRLKLKDVTVFRT